MKKHFTKYLTEDLGFKPFRRAGLKGELIPDRINDFSTSVRGGNEVIYINDDISITWGLSEYSKPPTLIFPRPNTQNTLNKSQDFKFMVGGCFFNSDDEMNKVLSKYDNEKIFEAMFDRSIILEV